MHPHSKSVVVVLALVESKVLVVLVVASGALR